VFSWIFGDCYFLLETNTFSRRINIDVGGFRTEEVRRRSFSHNMAAFSVYSYEGSCLLQPSQKILPLQYKHIP
jgi:hypothetical protein